MVRGRGTRPCSRRGAGRHVANDQEAEEAFLPTMPRLREVDRSVTSQLQDAKLEREPRGGHTHHVGRTLEWFRKYGFLCAKTEKRALIIRPGMPKGMCMIGPSQDLFGVADVVAIPPAEYEGRKGAWFVQVCARGGGSAHRKKALAAVLDSIPVLPRLEVSGNRFLIVNYQLGRTIPKKAGKVGRLVWKRRVEEFIGSPDIDLDPPAFVDWRPTDFELIEGLTKWERTRSTPGSSPVLSA